MATFLREHKEEIKSLKRKQAAWERVDGVGGVKTGDECHVPEGLHDRLRGGDLHGLDQGQGGRQSELDGSFQGMLKRATHQTVHKFLLALHHDMGYRMFLHHLFEAAGQTRLGVVQWLRGCKMMFLVIQFQALIAIIVALWCLSGFSRKHCEGFFRKIS